MEGKEVYGGTMSKQSMWNLTFTLFLIPPAIVGWYIILFMIALGIERY